MADIGVPELVIILVIVIICFGPSRIGGLGKSLGEGIRSFRESVRDENAAILAPAEPLVAAASDAPSAAPVSAEPFVAIMLPELPDEHALSAG